MSMPSRTPTEDLFDALRRGDEYALAKFLPPLRARLIHLAKDRLVGEELAEEVVQETLSTLWEKRETVSDAEHLLPFLFQILRNKIGNTYLTSRRQRRARRAGTDPAEALAGSEPQQPELVVAAHELKSILASAVDRCAAEHETFGQILRLLQEGRSPKEIQGQFGDVSMGTVHSRIHRARKRLKQILEEEFQVRL